MKIVCVAAAIAVFCLGGARETFAHPISQDTAKNLCSDHGGLQPSKDGSSSCLWCSEPPDPKQQVCVVINCASTGECEINAAVQAPPPVGKPVKGPVNAAPIGKPVEKAK